MNVYRIIPVKNTGMETKNPPTAHILVNADFFRYLLVLSPSGESLTSLTAKRNCTAQTSRQQRLRDKERAQSARVTSYTRTYSSGEMTVSWSDRRKSFTSAAVTGEILSMNTRDRRARSKDTRQSRPREVSISLTPGSRRGSCLDAGEMLLGGGCLEMLSPPLAILGTLAIPRGLTLLELPPNECLEVLRVETFKPVWGL